MKKWHHGLLIILATLLPHGLWVVPPRGTRFPREPVASAASGLVRGKRTSIQGAEVRPGKMRLSGETLGGTLAVNGQDPATQPRTPPPFGGEGRLHLQGLQLSRLGPALGSPALGKLHGSLDLDLTFRQEALKAMPVGQGVFAIHRLRWGDTELASDLRGTVQLTEQELQLTVLDGILAGGILGGTMALNLKEWGQGSFNLTLLDAEAAQVLAPWPALSSQVQGTLVATLRGRLGREWWGGGQMTLVNGRIFQVGIPEWRLPLNFSYLPAEGRGEVDIRDTTALLAQGRITSQARFTWGAGNRLEGQAQLSRLDLRTLLSQSTGSIQLTGGRVNGRLDFSGQNISSLGDLKANIDAELEDTHLMDFPGLAQRRSLPGQYSSVLIFPQGRFQGRWLGSLLQIQELALDTAPAHFPHPLPGGGSERNDLSLVGERLQIMAHGLLTLEGKVSLDVMVKKEGSSPYSTFLEHPELKRLLVAGPVPVDFLMNMNRWLSSAFFEEGMNKTHVEESIRPRTREMLSSIPKKAAETGDPRPDGPWGLKRETDVSQLIQALVDPDPQCRIQAAANLERIGSRAREAVAPLKKIIETDGEGQVRDQALRALVAMATTEEAVQEMAKVIKKEKDNRVRRSAISLLGKCGAEAKPVIPLLLTTLRQEAETLKKNAGVDQDFDSSPEFTISAIVGALEQLGPEAKEGVSFLLDLIHGFPEASQDNIRAQSLTALSQIAPGDPQVLSQLKASLKDPNDPIGLVRAAAAQGLAGMGVEAKSAVPQLLEALQRDYDAPGGKKVTLDLIQALGQTGSGDVSVISRLLEILKKERANTEPEKGGIRKEVIVALGLLGPRTEDALDPLVDRLENDIEESIRIAAAEALGNFGPKAAKAVPVLGHCLEDESRDLRLAAILALGRIGPEAKAALPQLVQSLKDKKSPSVREASARVLGQLGPEAKEAALALAQLLSEEDQEQVRLAAATALGSIHPPPGEIVEKLAAAVRRDPSDHLRALAAIGLAKYGPEAKDAVPTLVQVLQGGAASEVREAVALTLGMIGPDAKSAASTVPQLQKVLTEDPDNNVRLSAVLALALMGVDAREAVPLLIRIVNEDQDSSLRLMATVALADMGQEARGAILPLTVKAQQDPDPFVRIQAANALAKIALGVRSEDALADLKGALASLEKPGQGNLDNPNLDVAIAALRTSSEQLQELERERSWERIRQWIAGHPGVLAGILYLPSCLAVCLLILWLRPLWLLRLNEELKPYDLPIPKVDMKLPLRKLLLVEFFHFSPRVLDAWIQQHLSKARDHFETIRTVEERLIYIPIPALLNGVTLPEVNAPLLRPELADKANLLLITGEGGAGKTSVACQIGKWGMAPNPAERLAKHPMLPVLLEQELDPSPAPGEDPLLNAVQGQLQALVGAEEPLANDLFLQLLRKRRVLVIVDHFSEWSEAARARVCPGTKDFAVHALIVTSRKEEEFAAAPKAVLKPVLIQGNRLSSFMESYLTRKKKRDLFLDREFFEGCSRLSDMVGDRQVTVLLAKLYADQMASGKEKNPTLQLPTSIPDLILGYLNELNRNLLSERSEGPGESRAFRMEDPAVHRDLKIVAKECLRTHFRPGPVKVDRVMQLFHGEEAAQRLDYLVNRLRVVQLVLPGKETIRFALDPLGEYLAAIQILEEYRGTKDKWLKLFSKVDSEEGSPLSLKGFLLALWDCCLANASETRVPDFVRERLENDAKLLSGLEGLKSPDPSVRKRAILRLGELGPLAKASIPALRPILQEPDQDLRREATEALRQINPS